MPWNWNERGPISVEYGGNVGTRNEANVAHAWNKYELEILDRKLRKHDRETGHLSVPEKLVYLDKAAANYKAEADECLKAEFEQWLQGLHIDNRYPERYDNTVRDGRAERKRIQATENPDEYVGSRLDGWTPTWWGKAQLTHLPGVREYLREQKIRATEHELDMNLLAEFGPQNLEQAWQYFKHWVKKRPLTEAPCPEAFADDRGFGGMNNPVKRSNFGNMPHHFGPDRFDGVTRRPPGAGLKWYRSYRNQQGGRTDGGQGTDESGSYSPYEAYVPSPPPPPPPPEGGGGDGGGGGAPSSSGGAASSSNFGSVGAGGSSEPEPEALTPISRFQQAARAVSSMGAVARTIAENEDLQWDPTAAYGRPPTPPFGGVNFGEIPQPGFTIGGLAYGGARYARALFDGFN